MTSPSLRPPPPGLLKRTSRTLYLSLSALPSSVRPTLSLAYLLCRAADTLADSGRAHRAERMDALAALRRGADDPRPAVDSAAAVAVRLPEGPERELLSGLEGLLEGWARLESPERELVGDVVRSVTEGMRLDLARFPPDGSGGPAALASDAELEAYCGLAGGAPGRFWSRLCRLKLQGIGDGLDEPAFELGRGLQMTNILRDAAQDLRLGRCYFPANDLRAAGLAPKDLLDPRSLTRLRPVLAKWTRWALERLEAGEEFVLAMPDLRLRAAAGWPLLLALETLLLVARSEDLLKPERRAKVPRGRVYATVARSPWLLSSERRFLRTCGSLRSDISRELG